jgi:hypothetical protein
MGLDLKKLENVSEKFDGKTTARCPACAAEGGDSKGEHLVVFPDGRFGCVKYEGDAAHRSKIQSLAGDDKGRRVHIPVRLSVRPLEVPQPCVLLSLGEFPGSRVTHGGNGLRLSNRPRNRVSPHSRRIRR